MTRYHLQDIREPAKTLCGVGISPSIPMGSLHTTIKKEPVVFSSCYRPEYNCFGCYEEARSRLPEAKKKPCAHGQMPTGEHTHPEGEDDDCFTCVCCGNCREDVDSSDTCMDCGGVDESDG